MAEEGDARSFTLAKSIRSANDSEEYDLAGYGGAQIPDLVNAAFKTPIPLPPDKMIRVTFVIGGGKKVRQKYNPDLARELSTALAALDFTDDRGAGCVLECQGMFKLQHDTDKDLKFMHVFPRVVGEEIAPASEQSASSAPHAVAASCTYREFMALTEEKVMKEISQRLADLDQKLINMETLQPDEQDFYDSGVEMADKIEILEKMLETHVKGQSLTAGEQKQMLKDLDEKIAAMEVQVQTQEEKGKKVDKLKAQYEVVKEKRDTIAGIKPTLIKEKHAKELVDLRKRLTTLEKLEASRVGSLMSPDEAKQLAAKPQILSRIADLEAGGDEWFEDEFKKVEELAKPKPKPAAAKSASRPTSASTGGGGSSGGWSTTASKPRKAPGTGATRTKKPQNLFDMLVED
eukprot:gene5808-7006_t